MELSKLKERSTSMPDTPKEDVVSKMQKSKVQELFSKSNIGGMEIGKSIPEESIEETDDTGLDTYSEDDVDNARIKNYRKKNFYRNDYDKCKRLVNKNGDQNSKFRNVPKPSNTNKDIVNTIVEQHWAYTIFWFTILFVLSWFIFACLWYIIALGHGDLDFDESSGKRLNGDKKPCVVGVVDMTGMFIHSFELQSTIGFGEKYPTEECPEGVFLFVVQIIITIGIEGAMVAAVYTKMAKPIKRKSKLIFSKTACVHLRDGKLCLVFRVCDPREQKSISTKIRMYFVTDIETGEGETIRMRKELKIENDNCIIIWPENICHIIDKTSPFYDFSSQDFNEKKYEIFVSLIGHSPITGFQTESRTSYLPIEVNYGKRFINVILYNHEKDIYVIDYENFHTTIAVDTNIKSTGELKQN